MDIIFGVVLIIVAIFFVVMVTLTIWATGYTTVQKSGVVLEHSFRVCIIQIDNTTERHDLTFCDNRIVGDHVKIVQRNDGGWDLVETP